MDALEFLREHKRMCNRYEGCCDCPLEVSICPGSSTMPDEDYKKLITVVEHWSKEHPRKTRQSVFLEQWPDTQLDKKGNVIICPKQLCRGEEFNKLIAACRGTNCYECRRKFWGKVVQ